MGSDKGLIIAGEDTQEFCKICGLLLSPGGYCKKRHTTKNPKRGKYSGKSKTPFGLYEER